MAMPHSRTETSCAAELVHLEQLLSYANVHLDASHRQEALACFDHLSELLVEEDASLTAQLQRTWPLVQAVLLHHFPSPDPNPGDMALNANPVSERDIDETFQDSLSAVNALRDIRHALKPCGPASTRT